MFFYYTAVTILAILSQAIMLAIFKSDNLLPKVSKKYFTLTFIIFIIATFSEWVSEWILLHYNQKNFYYTLFQSIMFSLVPLIDYCLGSAFKEFENKKHIKVLIIFNVFLQLLAFDPFLENSSHNVLTLGNTYLIYFFISQYVMLRMFINIYLVSKSYQSKNISILIANIFIITIFAIIVQSFFNDMNTIAITSTVNSIILYYYYSTLINKRDGLTLLLNRRCFENDIKGLNHDSIFLFIDLNKFKEINDKYGHLFGDEILKEIAYICLETFNHHGSTYRLGGDEYCIVIRKHLEDIETLISTLHQNIDTKQKTTPLLPSVSVGYGYYTHNKNTVSDALNDADIMMYKLKNKHKIAKLNI